VITELPTVIEPPDGSATWGSSAVDHPMRAVTRAVAFEPDGWTPERQAEVVALFDSLAPEWTTRDVAGRELPIIDALDRGLAALPPVHRSVALELGGGTGLYSAILAERFPTLVTLDLSWEMVRLVPDGPALPVQGDGDALFPGELIDAILRVDAGAAEGLALDADDRVDVAGEVVRRGHDLVHDGAGVGADPIDPFLFGQRTALGDIAEGVDRHVGLDMPHGADDGRGIDAARQSRAQRHIAAQMQPHAVEEGLAKGLGRVLE